MCGCSAGVGAGATAGAPGTGGAGAFGPAAAAGKASVNRSVAIISRVRTPVFFMYSSSSAFRVGRNPFDSRIATSMPIWQPAPATPAQYSRHVRPSRCAKRLLPGCWSVPVTPPPPPCHQQEHENDRRNIQFLDGAFQPMPMLAEQITGAGYDGDPNCGTEKIENQKSAPGHPEDTGHGSGDNAHAEDETREENGHSPVSRKQTLSLLQG